MLSSARRATATLAAVGIVLAACGTAEDAAPNTAGEPVATAAPSDEPALTPDKSDGGDTTAGVPVETDAPTSDEPPADSEAGVPSDSAAAPVDEASVATDPPVAVAPEAVLGGRLLASELAAESDFEDNVLPDIQVDDIRRETKVSLRNVFPADRPVLLWLWAPH